VAKVVETGGPVAMAAETVALDQTAETKAAIPTSSLRS
jgi:hypothetical protein